MGEVWARTVASRPRETQRTNLEAPTVQGPPPAEAAWPAPLRPAPIFPKLRACLGIWQAPERGSSRLLKERGSLRLADVHHTAILELARNLMTMIDITP